MALAPLPHVYPFRFVDTILCPITPEGGGSVRAVISSNSRSLAGLPWLPLPVAVEMMAQAALLLQGGDPEVGRKGFLVGVDRVRIRGAIRPGDELLIRVKIAARFGTLVRFSAEIFRGNHRVGNAEISVKTGS